MSRAVLKPEVKLLVELAAGAAIATFRGRLIVCEPGEPPRWITTAGLVDIPRPEFAHDLRPLSPSRPDALVPVLTVITPKGAA